MKCEAAIQAETKAETTTEKEVQDVSANQVATVSENASEEAKTEINYEWYKEAKVYQRADVVKFQMGFLDILTYRTSGIVHIRNGGKADIIFLLIRKSKRLCLALSDNPSFTSTV